MAEIIMCKDHRCPRAKRCYRHEAKKNTAQSYFIGSPRTGKTCLNFWDKNTIKKAKP